MNAKTETNKPMFHPNQVVRNTHSWASEHPPRPVIESEWSDEKKEFIYSLPAGTTWKIVRVKLGQSSAQQVFGFIWIEESMLVATGDPDIDPKTWSARHKVLVEKERAKNKNKRKPRGVTA